MKRAHVLIQQNELNTHTKTHQYEFLNISDKDPKAWWGRGGYGKKMALNLSRS